MERHARSDKKLSHPPLYAMGKYSFTTEMLNLKFPLFLMNFYIVIPPRPKKKNQTINLSTPLTPFQ